nr:unnamed protein product [Callosobruchus analis]CAI5848716.1 unnamed protein product [Callosobruchus analis]
MTKYVKTNIYGSKLTRFQQRLEFWIANMSVFQSPANLGMNIRINRKGFAGINVQATCNAQEKLTGVDVQCPGSTHDSRIWKSFEP